MFPLGIIHPTRHLKNLLYRVFELWQFPAMPAANQRFPNGGAAVLLIRGDRTKAHSSTTIVPGYNPGSQMPVVSHLELADEPLISIKDIISYRKETHEIELTATAHERVSKLEVPVNGKVFVVCIDRCPMYWGAFWTPISSISFDGVTILKPLPSDRYLIQLQLGYPSPEFFTGTDPRPDPGIVQSLERANKLR